MHTLPTTISSLAGATEEGTGELSSTVARISHATLSPLLGTFPMRKQAWTCDRRSLGSLFFCFLVLLSTHDAHVTHTPQNTVRVCMCVLSYKATAGDDAFSHRTHPVTLVHPLLSSLLD